MCVDSYKYILIAVVEYCLLFALFGEAYLELLYLAYGRFGRLGM